MKDVHVIESLQALRALSDPLRLRIIEALESEPLTSTQIARRLDQKPNKLHYHMMELEKNGLIEAVETRQKGNLIERYYRPVATMFRVSSSLFESGSGPEALAALYQQVVTAFDVTASDLKAAIQNGSFTEKEAAESLRVLVRWRLSPQDARAFRQRLKDLLAEFSQKSSHGGNAIPGALSLLFYSHGSGKARDDSPGTNSLK